MGDPRIARLVEAFTYARGEAFLRRRRPDRTPSPEELAGWALERTRHDPVAALGVLRRIPMPLGQRRAATELLRPLVASVPLQGGTARAAPRVSLPVGGPAMRIKR